MTPNDIPNQFDRIAVFPKATQWIQMRFVMNPEHHLERYEDGLESGTGVYNPKGFGRKTKALV